MAEADNEDRKAFTRKERIGTSNGKPPGMRVYKEFVPSISDLLFWAPGGEKRLKILSSA